jgi:hypothetical protein
MAQLGKSADSGVDTSSGVSHSAAQEALQYLRNGDTSIRTFQGLDGRQLANSTDVDIFEVREGYSRSFTGLDDDALREHLKNDTLATRSTRRIRIIFLDGDERNAEILPITADSLRLIQSTYNISPRFFFYLSRQQMAGSTLHHGSDQNRLTRIEFWYSAVVRTMTNNDAPTSDNSRRVMNWLRCCVWTDFDAVTGCTTCLVWRLPKAMKQAFVDDFAGPRGSILEQNPMLTHAAWTERLCTHTRDINMWFFEPLYEVEHQTGRLKNPADLFDAARNLTRVQRQIRQVLTDYEIFLVSAKMLRKQNENMAMLLRLYARKSHTASPSEEVHNQVTQNLKQVRRELKLGKTYLGLYLERCNSGIQDMQAISTQHSAEIQIKTSKEFTQLSRDSTEDNQSLRAIQIMTAIFLPPSLISSLFGMGFFSTDRAEDGGSVFSVARTWWW